MDDISKDAARLTKIYRKIRDAKSKLSEEFKKKEAELDEQLDTVSRMLMDILDENQQLAMTTEFGSVRKVVKQRFWCTDWVEFNKFAKDTDNLDLFERRIAQKNMAEWLAKNPEAIPPGLQMDRRYDVTVTKPRTKPE